MTSHPTLLALAGVLTLSVGIARGADAADIEFFEIYFVVLKKGP